MKGWGACAGRAMLLRRKCAVAAQNAREHSDTLSARSDDGEFGERMCPVVAPLIFRLALRYVKGDSLGSRGCRAQTGVWIDLV